MSQSDIKPLAVTMGDPAGIGGEVLLMAWAQREGGADHSSLPVFFALDDPLRLRALAGRIGLSVEVEEITSPDQAPTVFHRALPVLAQPLRETVVPGQPNPAHASATLGAIERAVTLTQQGQAAGVVTLPINKHVLHQTGFAHPGHTEYLAALAGPDTPAPVMMLACEALKVIPVTIHLSVQQAVEALDQDKILHAGRVVAQALATYFGRPSPRLAVAGLNPHAGEGGDMGREEIDIIAPAIAQLQDEGIDAFGPAPADTLFHAEARAGYDACLCMYHDQALIPIKTIDFHHGVNVTLGLPFIRTSPDHGTAYGLAGTGQANPASFISALKMAAQMAVRHQRARRAAAEAQTAEAQNKPHS